MTEKEELRLIKLKEIEKNIYEDGTKYICGIDEAGRGPLARTSSCSKLHYATRQHDRRSKRFKKSFRKEERESI